MKKEKSLFGKVATAKNWKKILMEIYRFAPNQIGDSNKMHRYNDNHPLAKKLKITGQELGNTIAFLEDQKLIESLVSPGSSSWKLTEKGFNVCLEIEKQEREIREKKRFEILQWLIVILTAILSLSSILNLLS